MTVILLRRSESNPDKSVLAERLGRMGADSNVKAAEVLGVTDGTVSRVMTGKSLPGNKFMAAVLSHVPAPFDEIFETVDDEDLAVSA